MAPTMDDGFRCRCVSGLCLYVSRHAHVGIHIVSFGHCHMANILEYWFATLVRGLLEPDADKRSSARQALEMPIFSKFGFEVPAVKVVNVGSAFETDEDEESCDKKSKMATTNIRSLLPLPCSGSQSCVINFMFVFSRLLETNGRPILFCCKLNTKRVTRLMPSA